MSLTVCVSASAADRLTRARDLLRSIQPGTRVQIVGATRGAADDLARSVAATVPATFGIERLSLAQLAVRTAVVALAADGLAPSTALGAEAVATRTVWHALTSGALDYFGPVAAAPGFPRALARTLEEVRLAGITGDRLRQAPRSGSDLARLLDQFDASFEQAGTADRAHIFRTAARLLSAGAGGRHALVLLDLPLQHEGERDLARAAIEHASATLATIAAGDDEALRFFTSCGATIEHQASVAGDDLGALRTYLFQSGVQPPVRALDGSVMLFSAPGEGREAVEIVRRILREARRGVPFDEMAILVRSPHRYFGLLEHALSRADVPGWFDRGTRRPHPAGRAFLALLACRGEQLSAARFAEYLSLAQVPQAGDVDVPAWEPSQDDLLERATEPHGDEIEAERQRVSGEEVSEDAPVAAGTLRAPWLWERLLVDAAVLGQDARRWQTRLDGRIREVELQLRDLQPRDGDDPRIAALQQQVTQLQHLRAFALPVIERLAEWPPEALWGEWLDRFEALARGVLRTPAHVLRVLADLRAMASVGPVDLDEARRVLAERLLTVEAAPPGRRFGRVYVGMPHQARGRSFRVVFVPGLAERMFPQKPREDPLLLDASRLSIADTLPVQDTRLVSERLLLQLAAGAATERLYVSYPRLELSESRPRVPSFYALDVMRAAAGRVPDHDVLEEHARQAGDATLAWPAPSDPADAIDDQEHDLAVLRRLLDEKDRSAVRGHAHYLVKLNECLGRSVRTRWARADRRWSPSDGLTGAPPHIQPILAARRLTARPYSLTVLQRFSACPYQFLLSAFYKLQPLERPEPLQRMDPLTRGSIFHEIQAGFLRTLAAIGDLPVTVATADRARPVLDATVDRVAAQKAEDLAPAIERIWNDEIESMRRDLHAWLEHLARDGEEWTPRHFEFAFGEVPGTRDADSVREAVVIEGGFKLRGAVDLIEMHRDRGVLRVTDHKTGRKPDGIDKVVIGGGAMLQPILYAMAVEAATGLEVREGRLFYCTTAGSFFPHRIPINERTRAAGLEVLQIIDRAVAEGFLVAAPAEHACEWCNFRPVCGPGVFDRTRRKQPQDRLASLVELRSRP